MIRRAFALGLAGLVLCALAAPRGASAFVREESNWNPRSLPIHYAVNTSTIPSGLGVSAGVSAVDMGFATWHAQPCTTWATTDDGSTTRGANSGDSRNTILWVSGSWPAELGDPTVTIGVTTPVWTTGGYFVDADIQFNNVGFTWVALASCPGTTRGNQVDAQSIATHEEGHFLGLGHSTSSTAVMYASYSGGCKRNLTSDDANGVCTIYPRGTGCTSSSMCPSGQMCVSGACIAPPPDAGSTTGCGSAHDCLTCANMPTCGWCAGSNTCFDGNSSGPVAGSCGVGWVWDPRTCGASSTDAGTPPMGMGALGDPCMGGQDCSSGVCVSDGTSSFCSRICTDDCNCAPGYQCYPTTGTEHVCGPGTNTCSTTTPDSGTTPTDSGTTPADSGSTTPDDSGSMPVDDGGTSGGDAAITGPVGAGSTNCICRAGAGHDARMPLGAIGVAVAIALGARRRRG